MLSKSDLVEKVANQFDLSHTRANQIVGTLFDAITSALASGEEVRITGFGTFRISERGERTARNPRTGEPITVPAGRRPAFSAGAKLVEAVRGEGRKAA